MSTAIAILKSSSSGAFIPSIQVRRDGQLVNTNAGGGCVSHFVRSGPLQQALERVNDFLRTSLAVPMLPKDVQLVAELCRLRGRADLGDALLTALQEAQHD
jgi:hypothetical protein